MKDFFKVDTSYLNEMSDDELFTELGDSEFDFVHEQMELCNFEQKHIIRVAKRLLTKRGFDLNGPKLIQIIPLTNELINELENRQ